MNVECPMKKKLKNIYNFNNICFFLRPGQINKCIQSKWAYSVTYITQMNRHGHTVLCVSTAQQCSSQNPQKDIKNKDSRWHLLRRPSSSITHAAMVLGCRLLIGQPPPLNKATSS